MRIIIGCFHLHHEVIYAKWHYNWQHTTKLVKLGIPEKNKKKCKSAVLNLIFKTKVMTRN